MGKGRAPCCDKSQVKRGPWSPAEDLRLITFIQKHGHDNWRALPKQAGLLRCGKSCRLRWINYLRPDVKRGNFTKEEEEAIIKLHETLGNKWSKIASHFPGRTDNEIKNIWNTHLKKRLPLSKNCDSSGDESKESSITSSSSTSSSSNPPCGKRGLEIVEFGQQSDEESIPTKRPCNNNQLTIQVDHDHDVQKEVTNPIPNDQMIITSTTTSSGSSYGSKVSNNTITQVDHVSWDDHDHDQDDQMDNNLLFDHFIGPYDISDMLQEVNKPDIMIQDDHNKALDQTFMVPLEADYDFWDMLLQPNDQVLQALDHNSEPNSHSSNFGEEYKRENNIENWDWLRHLENELGLEESDNQIKQQVLLEDHDQSHPMQQVQVPENYFHYDVVEKPEKESDPCLYFYEFYNLQNKIKQPSRLNIIDQIID